MGYIEYLEGVVPVKALNTSTRQIRIAHNEMGESR